MRVVKWGSVLNFSNSGINLTKFVILFTRVNESK